MSEPVSELVSKPNQSQPVLECRGLSLTYYTASREIPAVVDFDLTVMPGETVGLVGESGCGKSSVGLAIMQYLGSNAAIVSGDIYFRGQNLVHMREKRLRSIRGSQIAMIYQEPMASLNPAMRVGEQLAEVPVYHQNVKQARAKALALEMMAQVNLPEPERIYRSYPHQLSGGQQQRIIIAMALLAKPELLILDEPTTALDVTVEAGIIELIQTLAKRFNTAIIFISHNLGLILETCDQMTIMYSGQAVERGPTQQVFKDMRHPYTQGLLASIPLPDTDKYKRPLRPIPGQIPSPDERPKGCFFGNRCDFFVSGRCDQTAIKMQALVDEPLREVRCVRVDEIKPADISYQHHASEPSALGDVVLDVQGLTKTYSLRDYPLRRWLRGGSVQRVQANKEISFSARAGETVAVVGESGCGKSTLAKVLMGLESATSGELYLHGESIGKTAVRARSDGVISALQMIFQNPFDTLNPSHTIGAQILRSIRKLDPSASEEHAQQRANELLALVKLPQDIMHQLPRQLSGGQKQRVGIARAFAGRPEVVIADEPTSALDVSVQASVMELLMDIQRAYQTTLLFISHDLSVVRYIADRVVVMYLGCVVEQGSTDAIFAPPYHPYTEALLSAVPMANTEQKKHRIVLEGELPSAVEPPSGCVFHTRCPRKIGTICETQKPPTMQTDDGHQIDCHIPLAELQNASSVQ